MTYPGSFAGHLVCRLNPDIDYVAVQSVVVLVWQNNQILTTKTIEGIDTIGQFFE